jgi:hypothetical protein
VNFHYDPKHHITRAGCVTAALHRQILRDERALQGQVQNLATRNLH